MTKNLAIKQYNLYMKETQMLSYAAASISFDDSTGAPKKAFKERSVVLQYHVLNGGPEKTLTNRCSDSSPRYSVRTIMQSLFVIRNFSGFH